jgi:asparagine synthase (glutamine-hydrolysing)
MVSKYAKKYVTVVMNGDGGDELLGGYSRYALSPFQMNISPKIGGFIPDEFASKYGVSWLGNRRSKFIKLSRSILNEYLRPDLRSLTMFDNFFNDRIRPHLIETHQNSNLLQTWRNNWYLLACQYANHPIDRMIWYDNHTYLVDDLLVKMDIASMHCGLETRSPLLDVELIEFCATLPVHFKNNNGVTKYLLKKLAEKYFTKDFIYRKKMGFGIPMTEWLRGPLKEMVFDTLLSRDLMEPLNYKVIERTLNEFMSGEDGYKDRIWVLLMYGLWKDKYNNFNSLLE